MRCRGGCKLPSFAPYQIVMDTRELLRKAMLDLLNLGDVAPPDAGTIRADKPLEHGNKASDKLADKRNGMTWEQYACWLEGLLVSTPLGKELAEEMEKKRPK